MNPRDGTRPRRPLHAAFSPVFAALAIAFSSCDKGGEKTPPPPPKVFVTPAAARDVAVTRDWIGSIDGAQNAEIEARVSGYLMSQEYAEGSLVKAGQVLFRIDPRPFEAALAQAKANLAQSQAKAQLSEITLARQTELFKTQVISEEEFDVSTQTAAADVAAAQSAAAALEAAELNLEFCTILAPFDGIAGKATAQLGDLVGPGAGAGAVLTSISQVQPVKVVFFLSEQEYFIASPMIAKADAISDIQARPRHFEIALANGESYPEKGVYDFINRQVDPRTGTIEVVTLFPNPSNFLRPGQYAKIRVHIDTLKDAVVIPQRAVNELQGTYYQVGVVGKDQTVEIRTVTPGQRDGSDWVITSGLQPGEMVVVEGLQKLRDGMKVDPQPFQPAPAATPSPAPAPATPPATANPAKPSATANPAAPSATANPAAPSEK